MTLKRLKTLFFMHLALLPMASRRTRPFFYKLGGANIVDYKRTFIGENVHLDTNYPEDVIVEPGVRITVGCTIVTHFMETSSGTYSRGKVHIKENAYLGANVIICKSVTIGRDAIVGAGSVVTKDIPDGEVWAGNPARFIKRREI